MLLAGLASLGPMEPVRATPSLYGEGPQMRFAGQYLEFADQQRIAIIKDGAYVQYKDLKLWADNIHVDMSRNMIFAEGSVILWRRDERYALDSLSYNYRTNRGRARHLRTRRGPALITARRMVLEPYRILGYTVATTTDDRDPPGYRIEAQKMIMLPRKKIVFKPARFMIGETTWFKLPTYIINLEHPERVNRLSVNPAWDATRGFNLRTFWDYYLTDDNYGRVYYNPSQFEGANLGLHHEYHLDAGAGGQFEYTRFDSPALQQQHTRYDLRHQGVLPGDVRLGFNSLLSENELDRVGTERKLTLNTSLGRSWNDWQADLTFDRLINLDSGLAPGADLVQYLNTTPQFRFSQVRTHSVFGTSLGLRLDGSIAQIEERTVDGTSPVQFFDPARNAVVTTRPQIREIDATKGELNLHFFPRPLQIGDVSTLNWNFQSTQNAYSTGDARNVMFFNVNTQENWGDHFSTGLDYVFQNIAGNTPFRTFDRLQLDQNLVTSYFRARNEGGFNATMFQTTYDIHDGLWRNAASNFVFRSHAPGERSWALSLTPIYRFTDPADFLSLSLENVASNLRVGHGDRWAHSLITNYDYQNNRISSVATALDWLLGESLRAEVYSNYSFNFVDEALELTKLNLAFTKDLGPFESRLRWNTIQREVFLEFYLKFASQKKVNVGLSYDENLQFLSPGQARGGFGP